MLSNPNRYLLDKKNICVSICVKKARDLANGVINNLGLGEVIELRLDCLSVSELEYFQTELAWQKPILRTLLFTLRPSEQGGKQILDIKKRIDFWKKFKTCDLPDFIDLEIDLNIERQDLSSKKLKIIRSFHDFKGVPPNLEEIYQKLTRTDTDVVKIAVQTKDITDSIPIWQLLKRAKSENREIILIAMGESGKWTRILGLAHGAFMTYASLDSNKETAPGQVTARDLIEVYRAKELDETTEIYGILGNNTSVSMSPYIHNLAFNHHKLNAVFVPLQVHNLEEFIKRMVRRETREIDLNFKGFAVTMPHKRCIIKHLDFIDETAEKIGAVNTVKIIDGKLYGYNTDAQGFIEPLKQLYGDLTGAKVALIGAGGASKACRYALEKEKAILTVFDGNTVRSSDFKSWNFDEFDIVVNSTPLGMKEKFAGESPLRAEQMKGVKLVYDLVYIPQETEFIKLAKSLNIPTLGGLEMLIAQAVEQQKIWTGLDAPSEEIKAMALEKLAD